MRFPASFPILTTARLCLRPFALSDAPAVQRLAGRAEIAATTMLLPHPYPKGAAETWIATHAAQWAAREELILAVTQKTTGRLVGSISLRLKPAAESADLGYWIGVPHWNRGYATEAARALMEHAFRTLRLNRIEAHHFADNPASGRVMEKAGLKREGLSPQAIKKDGRFRDLVFYGVVRKDWMKRAP